MIPTLPSFPKPNPRRLVTNLIFSMSALGTLLVLYFLIAGLHVIGPSEIGLKFAKGGDVRGLSNTNVVAGYVIVNPFLSTVIIYPRSQQNYSWTKSSNEGSQTDESFTFNSSDQVVLNADVNIGYQVRPESAPSIYIRFGPDISVITHTYVRSVIRNAITRQASSFTAEQLLGRGRAAFEDASQKQINAELTPGGFEVRNFSFIGELRAPPEVVSSINAKFAAQQSALQAVNKVQQATAEAQQTVATATGRAQSILLEAKAQAEANKILASSLTPELVAAKQIEKWNGVLPTVSGGSGSGFLINLPAAAKPGK